MRTKSCEKGERGYQTPSAYFTEIGLLRSISYESKRLPRMYSVYLVKEVLEVRLGMECRGYIATRRGSIRGIVSI